MSESMSSNPESRAERTEAVFTRLDAQADAQGRREHPRHSVDLDVSIGSDHNFYGGFAENLSAGGIFVATHMIQPVGEVIEFSIHLPGLPDPVRGRGEVRWIREYNERSNVPPGMGIRFVDLEPGSREAIERFLRHRDPLFFDDE
jgi:uncharacterized protein (TIGR02266 family)